jgi:hypothetical protein
MLSEAKHLSCLPRAGSAKNLALRIRFAGKFQMIHYRMKIIN